MIEAMKQALEALEYVKKTYDEKGLVSLGTNTAIIDLRKAIADAEKQPKREWVGLTDEEIDLLEELYAPPVHPNFVNDADHCLELIRHVEAKLKEKNT